MAIRPYRAMKEKIGDRIRAIRKIKHLSQQQFAFYLGVKRGYISTLEIHKNNPSEQLVLHICRAFEIRYTWLRYGNGTMFGPIDRGA